MLNIELKTETQDDMADLLGGLLMVRSISVLAKKFVEHTEMSEGYFELQEAFDNILMLIEPAMTYITNEMWNKPNKLKTTLKKA